MCVFVQLKEFNIHKATTLFNIWAPVSLNWSFFSNQFILIEEVCIITSKVYAMSGLQISFDCGQFCW